MLRALDDDLVNAKAIHPFVKFILMHQQIAIVDERRILVGNHTHGPTAFPRVSLISSADQDLRRRHAFVSCTERARARVGRISMEVARLRPLGSFGWNNHPAASDGISSKLRHGYAI